MTDTTTTAKPAKLRNGSWGARVASETIQAGDTITITTKAGKTWDAEVVKVVWHGDGVSLCTTESVSPRPEARRGPPECEVCGYRRAHLAHDLSGLAGYACYRCDDGFLSFG